MATIAPDRAWLDACIGFRVRSPDGHLGFVEEIKADPDLGEPRYLAVRAGRIIVLLVPIDEIESVVTDEGLIVLGPTASRLVPEHLGSDIVLRPRD